MFFLQEISTPKSFTVNEQENWGTHNVSVALWRSGGRVTLGIGILFATLQEGAAAIFLTVYRPV